MVAGLQAVNSGEMSHRAVQTTFNVPRATLQTRLNEKVTLGANRGGCPGSFTNKRKQTG